MEFLKSLKERINYFNSPFDHWELDRPLTKESIDEVCNDVDAVILPEVDKFSFPKSIAPPESVILPVASVSVPSILASSATVKSSVDVSCSADTVAEAVTLPVTVWAPDANVPLVLKFSFSKSIAPPESVIEPSAKVRFPTVEPLASIAS